MDEKLNRKMDEQLASRVAELDAHNDETGDGKLDAADLKAQLNRIEAQLELQDEQNRGIIEKPAPAHAADHHASRVVHAGGAGAVLELTDGPGL